MDRPGERTLVQCKPSKNLKQTGVSTNTDLCYRYQDPLAVHLLEVDALNIVEDMDLITSIKFLAHNTGRRLSQLEGRLAGNGCSLRSKFPHQEIRRWHKRGSRDVCQESR